jgi:two-component system OmpR family response regulator/two-component system response regulator QseB
VLDLGLPLQDGLDVLGEIRNKGITTPVIVLTARDAVFDRIRGLDRGADDYVIKPIDLDELAARLRALVRRAHGKPSERITAPGIELDPAQRCVEVEGQQVPLSPREFDLLQLLMLNAGRVLSRDWIEQHLYSWSGEVDSNAVEVHIHYLRRKIGAKRIATVRGVGYTMARDRGSEA